MAQITEHEVDEAAVNLAVSIDRLMDREWLPETGGMADQVALTDEWEQVRARVERGPNPLARCADSGLDYIAHNGETITFLAGKRPDARKTFSRHLALCRACVVRDECLDLAVRFGEKSGIWGGKFPHERRTP